jgi:hypothetical protein
VHFFCAHRPFVYTTNKMWGGLLTHHLLYSLECHIYKFPMMVRSKMERTLRFCEFVDHSSGLKSALQKEKILYYPLWTQMTTKNNLRVLRG